MCTGRRPWPQGQDHKRHEKLPKSQNVGFSATLHTTVIKVGSYKVCLQDPSKYVGAYDLEPKVKVVRDMENYQKVKM